MVSRVMELQAERHELTAEARGLLDAAEAAKRDLNEKEAERFKAIEVRLGEIETTLDRETTVLEAERRAAMDRIDGEGEPDQPVDQGFRSFGEQLLAVAQVAQTGGREVDPRLLLAQAGMSEGVPADGGFLVQTDFSTELMRLVHETGKLASRCSRVPISTGANSVKINAIDESSRATGSRWGGVQAYWAGEAGAITKTKPKFRQIELSLKKLVGLFYATDELLMDAAALEATANEAFAEEFGFMVDESIVRGSGAGVPLGILNSGALVSVAKEGGQAAKTVLAENIEAMYARMWAPSVGAGIWYINQDVWPQLFQLSHAVGTGGVPMFVPSNNLAAAPFGALLGRPIEPIEQCDTLGTKGDIIFADLGQYKLAEKGGIEAASSIHVQFLTDETVFRFILRIDGQPKRDKALTPFKGTAKQSSFVTLDTRA